MSPSTGIIFNNHMFDFSLPTKKSLDKGEAFRYYPNNLVGPHKQPLSSQSPTIIVDPAGNVKLVLGAAGGTRIISGIAFVSSSTTYPIILT